MDINKYESAFILYESLSDQRKFVACQSDWFRFYTDKSYILWDLRLSGGEEQEMSGGSIQDKTDTW